jgi:predicted transcriptional regulator YdeE
VALAQPRIEQSGELHIAGLSMRYPRNQMAGIPDQWNRFATQLQFVQGRVGGDTYGAWYDVLTGGAKPMTYVTGVKVGAFAPIAAGFTYYMIVPQQYAVFTHQGDASTIRSTVDAIFSQWLASAAYTHYRQNADAPDFIERYIEAAEGGKVGKVEIWVPVQKK